MVIKLEKLGGTMFDKTEELDEAILDQYQWR